MRLALAAMALAAGLSVAHAQEPSEIWEADETIIESGRFCMVRVNRPEIFVSIGARPGGKFLAIVQTPEMTGAPVTVTWQVDGGAVVATDGYIDVYFALAFPVPEQPIVDRLATGRTLKLTVNGRPPVVVPLIATAAAVATMRAGLART
jgi:hypothetical protein